jgi:hypothetical protein
VLRIGLCIHRSDEHALGIAEVGQLVVAERSAQRVAVATRCGLSKLRRTQKRFCGNQFGMQHATPGGGGLALPGDCQCGGVAPTGWACRQGGGLGTAPT